MQQPKLTRAEVGQLVRLIESRFAGDPSLVRPYATDSMASRLAQDCLAYMDALEQIHGEAKNSAGADTLWNIEMIARAVLPASEEATDATP